MLIRTIARLSIMDRLRVLWHGRVEIGYEVPRAFVEPPHAATVERLLAAMPKGARVYVARVIPRRGGPPMVECGPMPASPVEPAPGVGEGK